MKSTAPSYLIPKAGKSITRRRDSPVLSPNDFSRGTLKNRKDRHFKRVYRGEGAWVRYHSRRKKEKTRGESGSINSFEARALHLNSAWRWTGQILHKSSKKLVNTSQAGKVVPTFRQMFSFEELGKNFEQKKVRLKAWRVLRGDGDEQKSEWDSKKEGEHERRGRKEFERVATSPAPQSEHFRWAVHLVNRT